MNDIKHPDYDELLDFAHRQHVVIKRLERNWRAERGVFSVQNEDLLEALRQLRQRVTGEPQP